METNDPTLMMETELARAFELVSEISERIDDEVLCLDEMDLRLDRSSPRRRRSGRSPRELRHERQVRIRRLRPTNTSL